MSLSCECGAYRSFEYRAGVDVCRHCGAARSVDRQPLLVITGGVASGKSTVCRTWESDPRVFALDLDVVGLDPFVRRPDNSDYVGLWGFNLRLALEMQLNGLAPLLCGVCMPDQIVANPEAEQFAGLHVLALVCDQDEMRRRIAARPDYRRDHPVKHFDIGDRERADAASVNQRVSESHLEHPNSLTVLDTTGRSVEDTVQRASQWIEGLLESRVGQPA